MCTLVDQAQKLLVQGGNLLPTGPLPAGQSLQEGPARRRDACLNFWFLISVSFYFLRGHKPLPLFASGTSFPRAPNRCLLPFLLGGGTLRNKRPMGFGFGFPLPKGSSSSVLARPCRLGPQGGPVYPLGAIIPTPSQRQEGIPRAPRADGGFRYCWCREKVRCTTRQKAKPPGFPGGLLLGFLSSCPGGF